MDDLAGTAATPPFCWDDGPGVVELPDGRRIRGRGLRHPLPPGPTPDLGVYLQSRDPGPFDWEHRWIRWPDFRTPPDTDDALGALRMAFERAATERVEIACGGGIGRTGTALAAIAVFAGVRPDSAVDWVRGHYHRRAVETPWQRRWVQRVPAAPAAPRFTVRPYRDGDAPAMAEVLHRSVREVATSDYSQQQVEAWAPAPKDPDFFEHYANDGRTVLVAEDASGRVVAYTDVEPDGHIDHLFCHPDAAGHGAAAALHAELERVARTAGITHLYVEASEPARRFFERHGFRTVERRDLDLDGVAIHNYAMEKHLS